MSNERDELARVIVSTYGKDVETGWQDLVVADLILAAGYHKPRTITTAEELDALPFESVIRDAEGHVLERWGDADSILWVTVKVTTDIARDEIDLPATVLYTPDAAA